MNTGGLAVPLGALAADAARAASTRPGAALDHLLPGFDRLSVEEKVRRVGCLTSTSGSHLAAQSIRYQATRDAASPYSSTKS